MVSGYVHYYLPLDKWPIYKKYFNGSYSVFKNDFIEIDHVVLEIYFRFFSIRSS